MSNLLSIAVEIYTAKIIANSKLNEIAEETAYPQAVLIRDCIAEAKILLTAINSEKELLLWATTHDGVQYSRGGEFFIRHKDGWYQLCDNAKSDFNGCLVYQQADTSEACRNFAEFIRTR
jgi:hypothetical protein